MRHVAIISVLLWPFLSNAAAQDDPVKKDLAKLQGIWKVESAVVGGENVPAEIRADMSLTFKGEEVIPAKNPKDIATIKLDPSKKPAAIDLTEKNQKTSLGIYEINGDTLKLCFNEPGKGRPTTFESAKGSQAVFVVLKRDKK
jgi:uncharacterized protein (TIGR03067 family)